MVGETLVQSHSIGIDGIVFYTLNIHLLHAVDSVAAGTADAEHLYLGVSEWSIVSCDTRFCLEVDVCEVTHSLSHAAQTETDRVIFLRTDYSQEPKNSDLHKLVRRSELKALVSLKQSKKPWMTRIEGPIEFDKWLKDYQGDLILCDIDGERKLDLNGDKNSAGNETSARPVTLLVGPEGGFSPREIEAVKTFKNGKIHLLNLGNTRLRARTAAVIALGKVL